MLWAIETNKVWGSFCFPKKIFNHIKIPNEKDHNVIISAGQGNLSDKILRIGHLGLVSDKEIDWLIESLIEVINK